MDKKFLKKSLQNKFEGISHKWIKFDLDEEEIINDIKLSIKDAINEDLFSSISAKKLFKHFKRHEFVWLKYKKCVGRSHLGCVCEIIDEENNKLEINISPMKVLYADLLGGTPKSLKLFKLSKSNKADIDWVKPDDGISDDLLPSIEEEMTRLGYELYKMTILEKQGKLKEYINRFNIS